MPHMSNLPWLEIIMIINLILFYLNNYYLQNNYKSSKKEISLETQSFSKKW